MTPHTTDGRRPRRTILALLCAPLGVALLACAAALADGSDFAGSAAGSARGGDVAGGEAVPDRGSDVPRSAAEESTAAPAADRKDDARGLRPKAAPSPPAARLSRSVFACDDAGIPTFSDRPCGPAAVARSLSLDAGTGGEAVRALVASPRASTRPLRQPAAATGPGEPPRTSCASQIRQLDELDDRMREGYSSREAARLWKRWRDLRERIRTGRC